MSGIVCECQRFFPVAYVLLGNLFDMVCFYEGLCILFYFLAYCHFTGVRKVETKYLLVEVLFLMLSNILLTFCSYSTLQGMGFLSKQSMAIEL